MTRVFVLELPRNGMSLANADHFGEVVTLFEKHGTRPSIFQLDAFSMAVVRSLQANDYDPAVDYLCLTGSVIACALMLASVAATYGAVNVLLFSAGDEQYVAKTFNPNAAAAARR